MQVPLSLARAIDRLWPTLAALVPVYHLPTTSDLQVCIQCLKAAVYGAYYNVDINLKSSLADSFRAEVGELFNLKNPLY